MNLPPLSLEERLLRTIAERDRYRDALIEIVADGSPGPVAIAGAALELPAKSEGSQ